MFKRLLIWLGLAKEEQKEVTVIGKGEPSNPLPPTAVIEKPQWNAPWVFVDLDLLGLKEDNPKVAARYVPEWKHYGLDYKDLISADHAWCMMGMNKAFRDVGIKGTGSAGASSLQKWGKASLYLFGAALPIEHSNGKHHVNFFLYWFDYAKKIAVTLDRNRDNTFGVFLTDLSGKGDHVVPSSRWPNDWPTGFALGKEEVLAVYPWMVPGSSGVSGSTR